MITITLEDPEEKVIEKTQIPHEKLLIDRRGTGSPLLASLDETSPDCFASGDMPQLILELELLRNRQCTSFAREHFAKIIELAKKCETNNGWTLNFYPIENWKY